MAFHAFVAGERPTASQWNDWVARRVVADCTAATRPSSPVEGQPIYETDTDRILTYDGSAWVQTGQVGAWSTYTPSWTSTGTAPALGNGAATGRYQLLFGRTWFVQVLLSFGSTTTYGTGTYRVSLPSGLTIKAQTIGSLIVLPTAAYFFGITDGADGNTYVDLKSHTSTTNTAMVGISGTVPSALGTGNSITLSLTAESQA